MKFLNWIEEVMVWAIVTVAILAVLSGCASNEAVTVLRKPPRQESCGNGIPVCEKAHPRDRECSHVYCVSQGELDRMVRPQGPVLR